ncbi:MAG: ArsA family ATPase, partial [Pleurocapsa sp. SU_196_0]|nr:ArsA family ATPase [Pleurocapsa sp. SU_196_0]
LTDQYFEGWKTAQASNLQLVQECFHPLPILQAPFFAQEVTGKAMLYQIGRGAAK